MLTLIIIFSLGCNMTINDDCPTAYSLFRQCYSKYDDSNFDVFCENFQNLKTALATCQNCDVTPIMDRDFRTLTGQLRVPRLMAKSKMHNSTLQATNPKQNIDGQQTKIDCQDYLCFAQNPLQTLSKVYKSMDLREAGLTTQSKNQGQCGGCWAFGTVAVLEASILNDQNNLNSFWQGTVQNISLSEQFILSNTYGFNDYCNGGDFVAAMSYINEYFKTVDTTSDYPYEYQQLEQRHYQNLVLPPKLQQTNYLLPYRVFVSEQDQNTNVPTIALHEDQSYAFNQSTIANIKSQISRGFAVSSAMFVNNSLSFMYYNGQGVVAHAPCSSYSADHQVTFIGYGQKGGIDVWVVKNSWGDGWGANGSFYVAIGSDDYCIERYAFGLIPKYYDVSSSQLYQQIGNHQSRGQYQLDMDSNEIVTNTGAVYSPDLSVGDIVAICISGSVIVAIAVAVPCVACYVKRRRNQWDKIVAPQPGMQI